MLKNSVLMEQLSRYYTSWREANFVYEEWSKAHGLSFNSVMVLYSLYEEEGICTQKIISQKWVIPKQTVNMILKDFEKRRLIELVPMPSDKRNKLIKPTPAGKEYANKIISELRHLELFVIKTMGADRMKRMSDDLTLFTDLFRKGDQNENE
ncbi:MarR family transcriptional regulator [Ruminococcus sp. OA3]|uniref:MarR family transcriptional regulator n=1 Tax=Ruminococcus sp. OA3 TaxID=2914164 RepID=UPI001F06652E|nr:MarR family transcriptional regulator [Ruminococcus sp. OA3]MCH1983991.1 MarR family transcriptional regulator [Ruminococcus sp. OA3]